MTRERHLVIRATDLMIDLNNTITELYNLRRRDITSPYDPIFELSEICIYQLRPLCTLLAADFGLDVTVKMQFTFQKPVTVYFPC